MRLVAPLAVIVVVFVPGLMGRPMGPVEYGICQISCNAIAAACYPRAGATFANVFGTDEPTVAMLRCSDGLKMCSAGCLSGLDGV